MKFVERRKLDHADIHLTDHCNLNCKNCFHYSPLVQEPVFKDLEQHRAEMLRLAELTNHSDQMCIILMGGEPLLHPQVGEFCRVTRECYPEAGITIITNGTLIPKMDKDFFDAVNETHTFIRLSDYDLNPELEKILHDNIKLYDVVDRGDMLNMSLDFHGSPPEENFDICKKYDGAACISIRNGYIYNCSFMAYFDYFEKYFNIKLTDAELEKNGINMFTATPEEIDEYLNSPHPFCKYCNANFRIFSGEALEEWGTTKHSMKEWTK